MNKKIKSVSFNITNEKDMKILNHVKRRNFSGYVKKLIQSDMEQQKRHEDIPNGELSANEKLQMMKDKLNQRKS